MSTPENPYDQPNVSGSNPYGQAANDGANPYGQPQNQNTYGQNTYGQYGQTDYGQNASPQNAYGQDQYGQNPYRNSQQSTYMAGQPQPYSTYEQNPYGYGSNGVNPMGSKSKIVAGILGILLGSFGIHNFYLGNTGKGITQLVLTLLVFTAPISSIWGLVEGILILVSKPGDSWHKDARGFELQD